LFIGKIPVENSILVKGLSASLNKKYILMILFPLIFILAIITYFQTEEPPAQAFDSENDITKELNELMNNDPLLKGSLAGVSVRTADDGQLLYEHIGNTRLQPASVLKLFTAAAALSVLGEDYTFATEVLADGNISGKTLQGDLYLKGKGDPTLLPSDFERISKELKEKGIHRIEGDLVADDTWYDQIRYSADLTWNDEHEYYGSQISALTASPNLDYDAGTVIVHTKPGNKPGEKAIVGLEPETKYVTIVNQAMTVDSKGKSDIKVERDHGSNKIFVKGTIPSDIKNTRDWVSVWDPTMYALSLFKRALEEQGIEIVGKMKQGTSTDMMKRITTHQSMPLKDLLVPFMKLSNNGHAEVLVKEMGKVVQGEGSWEKGLEVMNSELAGMGIDTAQIVLRDGSGISHANLIPANEVTALLYRIQQETWFPAFQHSLPVAAASDRMVGGTMRNRMKAEPLKGNVLAKTGSLTGVSTLAGYVKTNSGKTLIFSVLLNNLLDDEKGRKIEDQIAGILARHP
jgi:serine-type D-Ala-D-Ala carboxypeptidase/endopeptidase (penicillin-binding protein 4)